MKSAAVHLRPKPSFSRSLLGAAMGVACLLILSDPGRPVPLKQAACLPTPQQTEGPFYPVHDQPEKDNDLTRIGDAAGRAQGQVLNISGHVRDVKCQPIAGALVEIWQASANGRYNHPDDQDSRKPLDPNFQYWGQTLSDQNGRYAFTTILPPPYPAGLFWTRPSHVHFKVHRRNSPGLTTQMYFAGDPHLEKDRIFRAIPPEERARVIVELRPAGPEHEPGSHLCRFDLTL